VDYLLLCLVYTICILTAVQIRWSMRSIQQFRKLDNFHKADLIWEEGTFLDVQKKDDGTGVLLYSLYEFYVEILVNESVKSPIGFRCFKGQKELEPYLEKIDISCLFTN
jgi:hypothetical protein